MTQSWRPALWLEPPVARKGPELCGSASASVSASSGVGRWKGGRTQQPAAEDVRELVLERISELQAFNGQMWQVEGARLERLRQLRDQCAKRGFLVDPPSAVASSRGFSTVASSATSDAGCSADGGAWQQGIIDRGADIFGDDCSSAASACASTPAVACEVASGGCGGFSRRRASLERRLEAVRAQNAAAEQRVALAESNVQLQRAALRRERESLQRRQGLPTAPATGEEWSLLQSSSLALDIAEGEDLQLDLPSPHNYSRAVDAAAAAAAGVAAAAAALEEQRAELAMEREHMHQVARMADFRIREATRLSELHAERWEREAVRSREAEVWREEELRSRLEDVDRACAARVQFLEQQERDELEQAMWLIEQHIENESRVACAEVRHWEQRAAAAAGQVIDVREETREVHAAARGKAAEELKAEERRERERLDHELAEALGAWRSEAEAQVRRDVLETFRRAEVAAEHREAQASSACAAAMKTLSAYGEDMLANAMGSARKLLESGEHALAQQRVANQESHEAAWMAQLRSEERALASAEAGDCDDGRIAEEEARRRDEAHEALQKVTREETEARIVEAFTRELEDEENRLVASEEDHEEALRQQEAAVEQREQKAFEEAFGAEEAAARQALEHLEAEFASQLAAAEASSAEAWNRLHRLGSRCERLERSCSVEAKEAARLRAESKALMRPSAASPRRTSPPERAAAVPRCRQLQASGQAHGPDSSPLPLAGQRKKDGNASETVPPVYRSALETAERCGWRALHPQGEPADWTVLHWAASEDRADLCLRLLACRADPCALDDRGLSALDHARNSGADGAWCVLAGAAASAAASAAAAPAVTHRAALSPTIVEPVNGTAVGESNSGRARAFSFGSSPGGSPGACSGPVPLSPTPRRVPIEPVASVPAGQVAGCEQRSGMSRAVPRRRIC
eukprot:TRINITY_DN7598_c0_g3_i1.p1 TRINITY_DN7598_c0_g3~~TRINITY_DN7598_c0_g3_i1.p1  ORF type:complete len:928 (-),score=242.90 TRINITY_DN7598_c0_g3_i1:3-2786(-)